MPSAAPALDESIAGFLVSAAARPLLESTSQLPGDAFDRSLALRKRGVEPALAAAMVDLLAARWRARARFPDADRLFFTAESLAQATSPVLAAFHADRLRRFATVADLGCGVGIDAIALARAGIRVTAIDRDPVRLIFARANAAACGVDDRVNWVVGDVTALDWSADAVFWDPARRDSESGARLSRHGDRYEPPLSFLETIRDRVRGGCLKLSPALPNEALEELNGVVAFLSENRECKEACVLFGDAVADADPPWSAALLPERLNLPGAPGDYAPGAELGAYIFDPDPAVIRADALAAAAERLDAGLVSLTDSYLTGDCLPDASNRRIASAYRVIESLPYRPRAVGAWLRERGIGRLIVKKRYFDREPAAVLKELGLKGKGGAEATMILVRADEGGHRAVICEPVSGELAAHHADADL